MFWTYEYTITPDGAKFKESSIMDGYKIMTFTNDKNFVAITNRNGVSNSNSSYRYSHTEDGFNVYLPGYSGGGNVQTQNLGSSLANGAIQDIFGYYPIAVSFGNSYQTMLVHLSNGNNYVMKRASDPRRPKVNY